MTSGLAGNGTLVRHSVQQCRCRWRLLRASEWTVAAAVGHLEEFQIGGATSGY